MKMRINTNSFKNAIGTVFLLATAFFVCSTLISMRSVFADPVINTNVFSQQSTRQSPRSNARVSNRLLSRSTVSRDSDAGAKKTVVSRGGGERTVSSRSITPTRSTSGATSRGVVSRNQNTTGRSKASSSRAVRARSTGAAKSRVTAAGSVMAGSRATTSTSSTSYTYLASKLASTSYSNIIDSTTGLISADAYSTCLSSYYTCMDEICTARSDTKGRCSCAGRATSFLQAEEQLEAANEELIKLSGQLSLLIATKGKGDNLTAAFSLTDAEKVMNCVSWKEAYAKYKQNTSANANVMKEWYDNHPTFQSATSSELVTTSDYTSAPYYCSENNNSFGFDISSIDGSGSDIIAQLKAWADAKDLAKQYTVDDTDNLVAQTSNLINIVNSTVYSQETSSALDSLANKWGYKLFEYAHNNVCGRVLDACFNGIYEACGNPGTLTDSDGEVRMKCANNATTNCPFNYNSYIKVDVDTNEVILNDRGNGNSTIASSAACFGYTTTTTTSTGSRSSTTTTNDPYASLRGPVADARRSIMQKYLLDANSACDVYGTALKNTAQNINYQKIAAEQALQQKRLEFKQEEEDRVFAEARSAIDNFNECISEIWECYRNYEDEDKWTTARIKSYCAQVSQVPHCYETMICTPVQTQLIAVVDKSDNQRCKLVNDNNEYVYTGDSACRNVVTISEILYGTGAKDAIDLTEYMNGTSSSINLGNIDSAAIREGCLQKALGCDDDSADGAACLRRWKLGDTAEQ